MINYEVQRVHNDVMFRHSFRSWPEARLRAHSGFRRNYGVNFMANQEPYRIVWPVMRLRRTSLIDLRIAATDGL
jgi:hypothetical protein